MRRGTSVDASIDLGIALETLYLNDVGGDAIGELSFRLRIRAARYLAHDPDERQQIFNAIGLVYAARSKAVHTGSLPERIGQVDVRSVLSKGYELTARTILQMIRAPQVDWKREVLS